METESQDLKIEDLEYHNPKEAETPLPRQSDTL